MSNSVWPNGQQPTRLLCPWDSLGKNTGVGCHALLQGIFLTLGSNPDLLHCRQILYQLSHKGSPLVTPVAAAAVAWVVLDSVGLHRWQPSRVLRPWDCSGKNTGVGCHFLLQCMHACMLSHFSHVRLCATPWTAATRLLCPWDSPSKNTGVGCHFLLKPVTPCKTKSTSRSLMTMWIKIGEWN